MSNPYWFASASELRQIAKYQDAGIPPELAAQALKAPVDAVRRIYAEKRA